MRLLDLIYTTVKYTWFCIRNQNLFVPHTFCQIPVKCNKVTLRDFWLLSLIQCVLTLVINLHLPADAISLNSQVVPAATADKGPATRTQSAGGLGYGRAISMSGMDLWGDMALGDIGELSAAQGGPVITSQSSAPSRSQGFSFSQPDTMPPRN